MIRSRDLLQPVVSRSKYSSLFSLPFFDVDIMRVPFVAARHAQRDSIIGRSIIAAVMPDDRADESGGGTELRCDVAG